MIFPILFLLLPLAGSIIVFTMKGSLAVKRTSLIISLAALALGIVVFILKGKSGLPIVYSEGDSEPLGLLSHLSMDGISLLLVMLTLFLTPLIIAASFYRNHERPHLFYGLILFMEAAFIGVFTTTDGLMFYIFWELALLPAWLICAMWGGNDRIRVTFKFFIYTFIGSLAMLGALIYVYTLTPGDHSFSFSALYNVPLNKTEQTWIFWALFFAFGVKIPIFPFHTWQPDTYAQSPLAGTMLLSGLMLKMGTYGLIRVLLPLTPLALLDYGHIAAWIAIAGIVYASLIAIMQKDLIRLFAYAGIAHVGLIAAGTFSATFNGIQGSVLHMLSHGIIVIAFFFMIDIIERRTGTRQIPELGGIAQKAPWFAAIFLIVVLAAISLPLTNGFVGEFMIMLGLYEYQPWMAAVAGLGIIFSAVYMLWMYQRVVLGKSEKPEFTFADLSRSEWAILLPLLIMIFWIGIYPNTFLQISESSVQNIISQIKNIY
jgi:NADH-quinone oxidoreductase subunit M